MLPQHPEKRRIRGDIDCLLLTVDLEFDHVISPVPADIRIVLAAAHIGR
jgi:hypothetical protein